MIYRLLPCSKTPLLLIGVLAALLAAPSRADTGLVVRFTTQGTILPRRGHEVLTLESTNVERLSAAILHVPEADALRVLAHPDDAVPEASEIWHGQIEVKPAPAPGVVTKSTLDVLQLVKPLQPGLYIATAHELTTGAPRAEAHKLFMISNIGLEAFAGADGLAVQARLLSEANPAVNIDIALVAHNNHEIARIRTDNDGIAHFNAEQISGKGEDTPAALYAYGADGEFTALPVAMPKSEGQAQARAMILTDRATYKPGDDIHGLVLVRHADGSAAMGSPVYVQLENADGGVAEFHTATASDSSGFGFTFHAPSAGKWTIRAYHNIDNNPVLLGESAIDIGDAAPAPPTEPPAMQYPIVISPGRRSFQPGETANVSVQPPQDSFVTVALVDRSVHEVVRQKIDKKNDVVNLPVPADASGGMYVIATAFTPPVEAQGSNPAIPLHRSFGVQWIDIDQGTNRMSVRIDTPERAEIGGKLPVAITLQDIGNKSGKVQLVGSDASVPLSLDPLAFFYGRRPLSVGIFDSYSSLIGGTEAAIPNFSGGDQAAKSSMTMLLWDGPLAASKNGKADFDEVFPAITSSNPRLRLSAIAWSDDRLGYGEASVMAAPAGKKPDKKIKPVAVAPVRSRMALLKPGQSVSLKAHEAIIASVDPIVATPAAFDNNKPLFLTASMPQFRDYMQRLISPANDDTLLSDAIMSFALPGQALDLPHVTRTRLLNAVQDLLAKSDLGDDQKMLAHYALLKGGRETILEVASWLNTNPKLTGLAARTARSVLASESPLFKTDAAIDATDQDDNAIALCLLAEANQPWPPRLAHGGDAKSSADDMALRLAQAAHLGFGGAKLKFSGSDQGYASATARQAENADTRPLHAMIVSNLPQ